MGPTFSTSPSLSLSPLSIGERAQRGLRREANERGGEGGDEEAGEGKTLTAAWAKLELKLDRMSSSPSVATRGFAVYSVRSKMVSGVADVECSGVPWFVHRVLLYQHRYENTRYNCIFKCSCIIVSPLPLD